MISSNNPSSKTTSSLSPGQRPPRYSPLPNIHVSGNGNHINNVTINNSNTTNNNGSSLAVPSIEEDKEDEGTYWNNPTVTVDVDGVPFLPSILLDPANRKMDDTTFLRHRLPLMRYLETAFF